MTVGWGKKWANDVDEIKEDEFIFSILSICKK